jgi:hypothetical protein
MPVHACGSRCAREGTLSEADPVRGRRGPSSEADLARGRRGPSSEADPARWRREPSSEADLIRGGLSPRARWTSLEWHFAGLLWWAAGAATSWIALCVCFVLGLRLGLRFAFFAGFKHDSPRFFRGPSWLSPTLMTSFFTTSHMA